MGYILLFAWCRCYLLFQSKHVVLIYSWNVSLVTGPNTGCLSRLLTTFWRDEIGAQKMKKQLFSKISSILLFLLYSVVCNYLATWRAAKLGIFTNFTSTKLPWCSQSTLCTLSRSPAASLSTWSQSWVAVLQLPKKDFCITLLVRSWW